MMSRGGIELGVTSEMVSWVEEKLGEKERLGEYFDSDLISGRASTAASYTHFL